MSIRSTCIYVAYTYTNLSISGIYSTLIYYTELRKSNFIDAITKLCEYVQSR